MSAPVTGKKRLDLAGVLIRSLFVQLFSRLCKDVKRYIRSCINEAKNFSITQVRRRTCLWFTVQDLVSSLT